MSTTTEPPHYPIQRWDGLIQPGSTVPQPGITVKLDIALNAYLLTTNRVPIKIIGTEFTYDNLLAYASVIPSALAGGFRPNYEAETHTVVLLPEFLWGGYPPESGSVVFLEMASPDASANFAEDPLRAYDNYNEDDFRLYSLVVAIVVLIVWIQLTEYFVSK